MNGKCVNCKRKYYGVEFTQMLEVFIICDQFMPYTENPTKHLEKVENYDEVAIIHSTFRNLFKTNYFITEKYHGNACLLFELFLLRLHARTSYQF